jgi:hypothetical protein
MLSHCILKSFTLRSEINCLKIRLINNYYFKKHRSIGNFVSLFLYQPVKL